MKNNQSKILLSKKFNVVRIFYLAISFILIIFVLVMSIYKFIILPGRLEVDFFDVGQGDSELIKTPSRKLVLVDGGPNNLVLRRLGKALPFYQKKIDYIILSHFHEDHIIGLLEVFKRYKVKTFIYIEGYSSLTLDNLLRIARMKNTEIISLKSVADIYLEDNCLLKVFNPNSFAVKQDQNNSVIVKLDCYKNTFLFSGDNSSSVEKALIDLEINIHSEVLKASHHGSNTANSEIFLKVVNPKKIIISSGLNNKFNHPSPVILERAATIGADIYRTDKQGSIRIFGKF